MIHNTILGEVERVLQKALIDEIPFDDPARAGVVQQGPLQGDPDPDQARISVTLHENDPDNILKGGLTGMTSQWEDEPYEIECGGAMTWKRRFTVKARCLLVITQEDKAQARAIASTVRWRIEQALLGMRWGNISAGSELVTRGVFADSLKAEMVQSGGPPDAYDYYIKIRFEVLTTTGVQL